MKSFLRNKLFIKILIIGIFIFLMPACKTKKKESLKVGYIPIAECAQLYVAKEMGYFEQEGIEVELVSLAGGATILDGLTSGSVDIGFSNVVSLVLRRARDSKFISVFGGTYESKDFQNHAILVNTSKWRDNPRETLLNAKIAVNTFRNIEEMMVRKYLKSIGIESSQVSMVETGFPRMLPLLEGNTVDAVSIVEPFITIAQNDTTENFKWLCNHYLTTTPRTLVATYVSSEEIVGLKPEMVDKFRNAMLKATNYIQAEEGQVRQIIGRYVKIPPELLSKIGLSEFSSEFDLSALKLIIDDMSSLGYLNDMRIPKEEEMSWKP